MKKPTYKLIPFLKKEAMMDEAIGSADIASPLSGLIEENEKKLIELWREHDSTHFYLDEFQELIRAITKDAYEAGKTAAYKELKIK